MKNGVAINFNRAYFGRDELRPEFNRLGRFVFLEADMREGNGG